MTEPLLDSSETSERRLARVRASIAYAETKQNHKALEVVKELPLDEVPERVIPLVDEDEVSRGQDETWQTILKGLRTSPERMVLALQLVQNGDFAQRQSELIAVVNRTSWWRVDGSLNPSKFDGRVYGMAGGSG